MLEDDVLDGLVEIVEPAPNNDHGVRDDVRQAVQSMRERWRSLEARKRVYDLTPAETRDQLQDLSKTLARAAKLARGLGPYNAMLGSRIGSVSETPNARSSPLLSQYLGDLRRAAEDLVDNVPVGKGHPQRDPRAAMAAHYALKILVRAGESRISSTDGGKFRTLAEALYELSFKVSANETLARYAKREMKIFNNR